MAKDAFSKDQNPQNFSSFTTLEGLLKGKTVSLLQDRKGNLWIGSWEGGVVRYDGKYFTRFTEKEGLPSNEVWSLLEDRAGNIWFGTSGGVTKYDGKNVYELYRKWAPELCQWHFRGQVRGQGRKYLVRF
jgi:ligand-binding sensor domain-containing protein